MNLKKIGLPALVVLPAGCVQDEQPASESADDAYQKCLAASKNDDMRVATLKRLEE